MLINNKLDKIVSGPTTFVGILFFITGVIVAYVGNVFFGVAIVVFAAFFLTSFTGVEIDTDARKIKQYNKLFGIVKTGKWEDLDQYIGLTLVPIRKVTRIASRSNLVNSTVDRDYRIFLVNQMKKPALAIKICKTPGQAQNSIDEFSVWLKLPVYSINR